ncbi:hypothetical protein [Escherichia phage vB_EcoP_PAS7]|uniref:HNH nuclease domain-containing protein n=1 Tax=Escherichia phage vB_EcoP_PAS7 TaxID=3053875 RepID=A0AA51VHF4_9CAUD|nr:hypothetical protein [Escherichia phage vB_EcoP_PAS7]
MTEELIREYLALDPSSPTNLKWIKTSGSRVKLGSVQGYLNSHGYVKVKLKGKALSLHRAVFLLHYGYLPYEVDHVNRDKTDNRPDNLRAATRSSNCHNKNCTGFNFDKKSQKFRVRVQVTTTKRITVGWYDSPFEARAAYLTFKTANNLI